MFDQFGYDYQITEFKGDLCKDKNTAYQMLGWHYYYAILSPK